jgi:hypothetical protein
MADDGATLQRNFAAEAGVSPTTLLFRHFRAAPVVGFALFAAGPRGYLADKEDSTRGRIVISEWTSLDGVF